MRATRNLDEASLDEIHLISYIPSAEDRFVSVMLMQLRFHAKCSNKRERTVSEHRDPLHCAADDIEREFTTHAGGQVVEEPFV